MEIYECITSLVLHLVDLLADQGFAIEDEMAEGDMPLDQVEVLEVILNGESSLAGTVVPLSESDEKDKEIEELRAEVHRLRTAIIELRAENQRLDYGYQV
jgi:hypothetical protein